MTRTMTRRCASACVRRHRARRRATTGDGARDAHDGDDGDDSGGGGGGYFADKVRFVRDAFHASGGARTMVETFPSPRARGFRTRAAFGIVRGDAGDARLATASGGETREVEAFPDGAEGVERAAGAFARVVNRSSHAVGRRVVAVNFLTNREGDQVVVGVTTRTKTKTKTKTTSRRRLRLRYQRKSIEQLSTLA